MLQMNFEEIRGHIQRYITISDNILIFEHVDQLSIDKIADGVLIIWVTWSPGFQNCVNAIKLLQENNYCGQIIIVDNDSLTTDFQKKTFGRIVLHGWGEIFLIKDGYF